MSGYCLSSFLLPVVILADCIIKKFVGITVASCGATVKIRLRVFIIFDVVAAFQWWHLVYLRFDLF
jgi:hypothetical protein